MWVYRCQVSSTRKYPIDTTHSPLADWWGARWICWRSPWTLCRCDGNFSWTARWDAWTRNIDEWNQKDKSESNTATSSLCSLNLLENEFSDLGELGVDDGHQGGVDVRESGREGLRLDDGTSQQTPEHKNRRCYLLFNDSRRTENHHRIVRQTSTLWKIAKLTFHEWYFPGEVHERFVPDWRYWSETFNKLSIIEIEKQ